MLLLFNSKNTVSLECFSDKSLSTIIPYKFIKNSLYWLKYCTKTYN